MSEISQLSWIKRLDKTFLEKENIPIKFLRHNNEGESHWVCKNIIFDFLSRVGCSKLVEEMTMGSKRFDLYGTNPNGTKFAVEIGEFNCPSRLLRQRLKESFEYIDFIFWMPRDFPDWSHYIDVIRDYSEGEAIYESMFLAMELKTGHIMFGIDLEKLFREASK